MIYEVPIGYTVPFKPASALRRFTNLCPRRYQLEVANNKAIFLALIFSQADHGPPMVTQPNDIP